MSDNNRRSLPRRAAKRKPEDELTEEEAKRSKQDSPVVVISEDPENVVAPVSLSYRWIDEGTSLSNGQVEHTLLETIVHGKTTIIAVGDTILLRSGEENSDPDDAFVAKVERMWQAPPKKNIPREYRMQIRARWYFKKMDVQQLKGTFAGPLTKQQLLATITNRDLVLSNQYDDNDVLTVLDKCTVVNRRPGEEIPPPDMIPRGVFVSRYSISFGDTPGTSILTVYDGENQPWPDSMVEATEVIKPEDDPKILHNEVEGEADYEGTSNAGRNSSFRDTYFGEADTDGTFEESGSETSELLLSEGTNTKGKIQIGPEHQANLDSFDVDQQVVSRNPQLIWLKAAGSTANMDKYLTGAAEILFEYLEQNGLLTQEPYFPFPEEKTEDFLNELGLTSMTLSNLSTGSSMTKPRSKLTRECKLDQIIELLHTKEYNVDAALHEIKSSPQDYVTLWTKMERDLFDNGFRRYSGSLRMIAANSLVSKNFKDAVDYHYRFKIPGQFRRNQDKKREHAVRMMEIIENRRSEDTSIVPKDDGRRRSQSDASGRTDWSKTSVFDVIGVVDERRTSAKDLLFDIQQAVGTEKMKQICRAIKSLHSKSVGDLKDRAEEILQSHPGLLDRFLDYLPKRFRT